MVPLQIDSLTVQYDGVTAVRDLDLTIRDGEVFGFLGPNGAGKSTTIDVITDLTRPTSGSVTVLGHDPQTEPRAVRERLGVLPEATGYYERATAREHLAFAVEMHRAATDPTALLERVGLADAADRPVGGFSKGMRQRLGLAVALVGDPELLVLDEPLGGLDPEGARILREVVRAERDAGTAVFFSSHIMSQVEVLCDRVGILHDGELVAVDTVAALRERMDAERPVVLTVAGVPGELDVRALDGVVDVEPVADCTRITCRDAAAMGPVVGRLDGAGATVRDVSSAGGTLEQLFLAVTAGDDPRESTPVAAGADA
jgi:ABC-2 type transport system ATP-binding protein